MHIIRRCGAVVSALCILLCTALCSVIFASAANNTYSLVLHCLAEDEAISDMHWNLYYLGQRGADNSITISDDFAEYPVILDDSSASALQAAADTYENYAVLDGIAPLSEGISDENGNLCFDALQPGLYLLSGETKRVGYVQYVPSAAIVEITSSSEDIDLQTYPKISIRKVLTSSQVKYTVTKVWEDDDNTLVRPSSLKVGLYLNGELSEEVTLDESNSWTYTWTASSGDEWRVKEIEIPENYTVVYRSNETQFVIVDTYNSTGTSSTNATQTTVAETTTADDGSLTDGTTAESTETESTLTTVNSTDNSDTSEETTSTKTSSDQTNGSGGSNHSSGGNSGTGGSSGNSNKLPQTGQLWWPVPILLAGGLIMIAVGWKLHRK